MSIGGGYIFVILVFFVFYYLMEVLLPESWTDNGGQFLPAFLMAVIAYVVVQLFLS